MTQRTHARKWGAAGRIDGPAHGLASRFLAVLLYFQRLAGVALRLVAAFALLSAQVSASYSQTSDPAEPAPNGRLALIIGNSAYRNVTPLKNPGNDAKLIAGTLRGLGFEVIEKTDLTRKGFQAAVDDLARKAQQYESVLLYYAGHGFQIDGSNYLVPVDSKLRDRKKFASETIDLNSIIGKLEGENRNTLILLDACRNNPAEKAGAAAPMSAGLAQMETGNGTFVAFATQPGNITRDGAGDNSPFSIALAEHMQTEGISISDMMIRVRNTVEERTAGEQTPWDQSSLRSQFYFNPVVEATDSLTEEDLALLEQLDPALREKFMKRFGLNLNEDGTAEGEEVVATVVPSLRIEADFAEAEDASAPEPSGEAGAEVKAEDVALAGKSEARTTTGEPSQGPRKPSLMVLAMPDEEPEEPSKIPQSDAPAVAKAKETAPEMVALAKPEEIAPVIPKPEPAPAQTERGKPAEENSAPVISAAPAQPAVTQEKASPAPAGEKAVALAPPAPAQPDSGSSLSETLLLAPLAALSGLSADESEEVDLLDVPEAAKQVEDDLEKPKVQAVKPAPPASAAAPVQKQVETVVAPSKPATPAPKPAEAKPADVKIAESKPAQAKPAATIAKPAIPSPPAPTATAKLDTAAKPKPAPETTVALAKQTPATNTKPSPPAKQLLAPTLEKPVAEAAPAQTAPKLTPAPNPVVVAKAPPAPAKAAEPPASPAPASPAPVISALKQEGAAAKPAPNAAATPALSESKLTPGSTGPKVADADNKVAGQNSAEQTTGRLTATAPVAPAASVVPDSPAAPAQDQPAKEQLLAMADPAPATKLAPAASEAAAAPAQPTGPSAGKLEIPLPGDETDEAKKELAIKAQKELTRLGCYRNETDGDWGPRSARALLRFYAEQKLEPDQLEPTAALVERLTSINKVICKNTETDRPKQTVKKAAPNSASKTAQAPAKAKAPAAQKAPAKAPVAQKPRPVAKAPPPAVAQTKPAVKKKIDGGALIGAFR